MSWHVGMHVCACVCAAACVRLMCSSPRACLLMRMHMCVNTFAYNFFNVLCTYIYIRAEEVHAVHAAVEKVD